MKVKSIGAPSLCIGDIVRVKSVVLSDLDYQIAEREGQKKRSAKRKRSEGGEPRRKLRSARVVYIHPDRRYCVVEYTFLCGRIREAFFIGELQK